MYSRLAVLVVLLLAVCSSSLMSQALQTRAERTNYAETSRYDEVVSFLNAVGDSALVHTVTFGYSYEGRPLPPAVVGRIADARSLVELRAEIKGRTPNYGDAL